MGTTPIMMISFVTFGTKVSAITPTILPFGTKPTKKIIHFAHSKFLHG